MVNKNILRSRIEKIDYHLSRIKSARRVPYEIFRRSPDLQDVVEYNLFQIINHMIDLCHHIVVDEGLGMPQAAYEAVEILGKKRVFSADDVMKLRKMIGFRNVIGHDIDKKIVYEIWTQKQAQIRRIIQKITDRYL